MTNVRFELSRVDPNPQCQHQGSVKEKEKELDALFHPTVRERFGEDQDIVGTPFVRCRETLRGLDEPKTIPTTKVRSVNPVAPRRKKNKKKVFPGETGEGGTGNRTHFSQSSNSHLAASTLSGSAQTPLLSPNFLYARSPPAMAIRYEGMGTGWRYSWICGVAEVVVWEVGRGERRSAEKRIGSGEWACGVFFFEG